MSHRGICITGHTKQKDVSMFHKYVSPGHAKNMFMLDFGPKHTKARELVNARACQEIIVFPN